MKIGFFTDTYLPKSYGTELSIENFRQQLELLGHQVFIFCPNYGGTISQEKIWRFQSVKIKNEPIEERILIWSKKIIREIIKQKLDIVHAHTPFSAGWLAQKVAKKTKVPLFYSSHMLYPEYAKYWLIKNNKLLPFFLKKYLKYYGNKCQALIAPSLKMKKLLENYGVQRPIFVLPTGLDLKKIANAPKPENNFKENFGLKKEDKILLYVGRITEEKNISFLINAFQKITKKRKDTYLLLVGDGPLETKMQEKVKKLKIISRVLFLGRLPWEKVLKLYQTSRVFVFASLTDTQGLIIAEASYFGLPIVALKDDCYANILINNKNGLTVYPHRTDLFAEKVLTILDNPELAKKFSDDGRQNANNLSAEKQAQKLIEIYQKILHDYKNK